MTLLRAGCCAVSLAALVVAGGCRSTCRGGACAAPSVAATATQSPRLAAAAPSAVRPTPASERLPESVRQVTHDAAVEPDSELVVAGPSDRLFAGQGELSLDQLTELVLARNASLQAMTFTWRAAQQRYPQAIALDDPNFMSMIAPASFASNQVQPAYVVGGSQKLPWFGKRQARGDAARADASAMFHDVRDARLQLVQSTRMAFYEYYLIVRELDLNRANLRLTSEFRDSAQTKYENNLVTQQDVLQADVELAGTERRLLELDRMYRVAVARINTLLQRAPAEQLPPPPSTLGTVDQLPPADALRQMALSQRPDLAAIASRVSAEQAAVNLAQKQFYPDAEFYGRYDSFWQPAATQSDLRSQVGMNMNVPIYRNKLNAAVCEAQLRLSQRQAEYRQKMADVQFEVESAYAQVLEAQQAIQLYRDKLLPAAEQTVDATRANYDVGKTTFLNLLAAQTQALMQREQYQQALAAYHSRLADLERAIGGSLPAMHQPEGVPTPPQELSIYKDATPAQPSQNTAALPRNPSR
jgi:outer membrane protein, heavy metal efflux system